MDEKAVRRGHDYVTLFADLKRRRLLHATPGRKAGSFAEFKAALEAHGGKAEQVRELCMDMSKAYRKGAREHFPAAGVTFDRFHVAKLFNEAVDAVRRREQKHRAGDLRKTRWLWLRNRVRTLIYIVEGQIQSDANHHTGGWTVLYCTRFFWTVD